MAGIFEFLGAALLGASVTKTIRSNILDMDVYQDKQEVLAFGMLVALVNASFWLILATAYGLPVSTTHTVIAAIIGFSLAAEGFESIMWMACGKIFISWIAAPAITGLVGFLLFFSVKKGVLESAKPFERAATSYSCVILYVVLSSRIRSRLPSCCFVLYNRSASNFLTTTTSIVPSCSFSVYLSQRHYTDQTVSPCL